MKTLAISVLASLVLFGCASAPSPQKAIVIAPATVSAPMEIAPPAPTTTTTTTTSAAVPDPWASTSHTTPAAAPTDEQISGLDHKTWEALYSDYNKAMHRAIDAMHRGDYAGAGKQIEQYRRKLERAVGANASELFVHRFCVRAEEGFGAIRASQKATQARKVAMCELAEALNEMHPPRCDFELVLHLAHIAVPGGRCGQLTGSGVTIHP